MTFQIFCHPKFSVCRKIRLASRCDHGTVLFVGCSVSVGSPQTWQSQQEYSKLYFWMFYDRKFGRTEPLKKPENSKMFDFFIEIQCFSSWFVILLWNVWKILERRKIRLVSRCDQGTTLFVGCSVVVRSPQTWQSQQEYYKLYFWMLYDRKCGL